MSRTRTIFAILLFLASIGISLPLVAGMLGRVHPAFDSFAHFRWHLSLAMIAVSLLLLATRFRLHGLLSGALGVAALWTTLPGMGFGGGQAAADDSESSAIYRLLQLNLRFNNPEVGTVLSLIGRTKPDVVTLNEVSAHWQPHLEKLAPMYPYRTVCGSPGIVGGVAILSRRPLAPGQFVHCNDAGGLATARIDFGGRWVDIGAMHLHWPWPFQQPAHIKALSPQLSELGETALLAGDLNAATWSAAVETVAAASGTTPVEGIGATWLTPLLPQILIDYMGLPIDHVFWKGGIVLRSVTRQEHVGSDHLPVLVEFSLSDRPGDSGDTVAIALLRN
ncbi:MAG TPA: endonuclease/exonuclease/phosphatase family protein [Rhizobiaceae bacterium]|nr:endonuclease/exonuclease/phosphatase family protein [Rhizobiaceae bacterium]